MSSANGNVDELSAPTALVDRVKAVHRMFPTGVTIVTTWVDERPYGLAVNAFSSISLEPPAVLVCVAKTSVTHAHLLLGENLAVNMLSREQRHIAARFARSGGEKFRNLAWRRGTSGAPILEGVSAHLELEIDERVSAYTHTIFLGRVIDASTSDRPPLVYLSGRFYDGARLRPIA